MEVILVLVRGLILVLYFRVIFKILKFVILGFIIFF